MPVDVKKAKATTAKPPPLMKGRRGSQIPTDLLESMKELIAAGEWASLDATFDTRDKASSAQVRFKKALGEMFDGKVELTGRIWGDNKTTDETGTEVYAAPFHFAIGDKSKVS